MALSGPAGLSAARKGGSSLQHEREHPLGRGASLAVVAACDGAAELVAASAGGAGNVQAAVSNPPRVSNHTRRLTVPTYCLSTTTRPRTRRRSRRALGGDDEFDGGDGGDGGWGGDDGWWRGGDDDGEDEGAGGPAARLQDLLLLWSLFCGLAFCQVRSPAACSCGGCYSFAGSAAAARTQCAAHSRLTSALLPSDLFSPLRRRSTT